MSFQDRAQHQIAQIDKELSKYPVLNNFERQTSVPKVYAFLGVVAVYFFLVFFNLAGEFLVNIAGFLLPGFYSLQALFTTTTTDDTQWLTYWVVFSFLSVIESAVNAAYWFPFFYLFKLVFVMWMALPQTRGAQVVFNSVLQPVFSRYFPKTSTSSNLRSQAEQATKDH